MFKVTLVRILLDSAVTIYYVIHRLMIHNNIKGLLIFIINFTSLALEGVHRRQSLQQQLVLMVLPQMSLSQNKQC